MLDLPSPPRHSTSTAVEPPAPAGDHTELPFVVGVLVTCITVVMVVVRLTGGVSASDSTLEPVELRALAQQATLRVASGACGSLILGSGFIVNDQLLTNAHLVGNATEIKADQPIDPAVVPLIAVDRGSDLAAAAAPPGVSLVFAPEPPALGDAVVLAGHADGGTIEVREGTIANRVPGRSYGIDSDILLIEGATRGGYSGGPVLDLSGRVVGILSGFDRSTGLTVALPVDVAEAFSLWARSQRSQQQSELDCG